MSGVTGRAGPVWEETVARRAREAGLPWDRERPRGNRDLLDISGALPAGFLVGCKAIKRGSTFGEKISEAMAQCDRALINLGHPAAKDGHGLVVVESNGIIPVQVMQRSGYPVDKAYVVCQYGHFLDLAVRRSKWRDDE